MAGEAASDIIATYDAQVDTLAAAYEATDPSAYRATFLDLLPTGPDRLALDVGAGSGRDAAWLAGIGFDVVAAEPSAGMRAAGQRLHGNAAIRWIDDRLPGLETVHALGLSFDLILLSGARSASNQPRALAEWFSPRDLTERLQQVQGDAQQAGARECPPSERGKTLLFATRDDHADLLVQQLQIALAEEYGPQPHDLVEKITGTIDKQLERIKAFKNDPRPKYVVTVDLLSTGVDVPAITNLVFVRRVNSRISLAEQLQTVEQLDKAFARANRLVAEAARARELLDRMEAAVLSKAFRGELVMQDPADEPASILLDRIRTEHASANKPTRLVGRHFVRQPPRYRGAPTFMSA